jgi:ATPase subunit of ABC transporter with duplicated ATPase domains
MAVQRTSFEKLQRDRAKKAKAAAKREKRLDKTEVTDEESTEIDLGEEGETLTAAELLVQIERIHKQFDDGDLTFEDFEELKTDLLARLPID